MSDSKGAGDSKLDDSSPTIEVVQKRPPVGSLPEIKIGYAPAGRATLEAIADELRPVPAPVRQASSPEISVRESFAERDTLAAILEEANSSIVSGSSSAAKPEEDDESLAVTAVRKAAPAATPATSAIEVFEMLTFVVRGVEPGGLSSEALRRRFVEERLLKRLPVASIADVDRVDVTPWTVPGTLVVRVWCKSG
ncbi:MAG TPA: hypothetical protein VGK73_34855 [Polyangiaceae bacterium]